MDVHRASPKREITIEVKVPVKRDKSFLVGLQIIAKTIQVKMAPDKGDKSIQILIVPDKRDTIIKVLTVPDK